MTRDAARRLPLGAAVGRRRRGPAPPPSVRPLSRRGRRPACLGVMYRGDTSRRCNASIGGDRCWRSRSSACSTRARCTATSSASACPACWARSAPSPTGRSTPPCAGCPRPGGSPRSRRWTRRAERGRRRGKRVYRLTAEGKEHLAELLSDVGPDAFDDEGFGARLAFFAQTRSDIRLQILEGRRRRVEEQRDGMRIVHRTHRGPARPLHPRTAATRLGIQGPRGPLVPRADRARRGEDKKTTQKEEP